MKKYWFILLFYAMPSHAMPPYFGINVGTNLSFDDNTCVSAAKSVLKNNGFEYIEKYKNTTTVFAAYRKVSPYQYKALIKCMAGSGVITIVTIANVPRNAKQKADTLMSRIQKYKGIAGQKAFSFFKEPPGVPDNNISFSWAKSLLGKKECMSNAERSLRRSGFYDNLTYDNNSVNASNKNGYQGVIRCSTANRELYFQVSEGKKVTRERLIKDLEKNFY
ncbi:MAG: hypothetical protein KAG43_07930 [Candidatus Marithrix sp.]|nr:hypothetical protein [Candidatus Marithrix sp.]